MRAKLHPRLKLARSRPKPPGLSDNNGYFIITGPGGRKLHIIASDQLGWDHVSVTVIVTLPDGFPKTLEDTVPSWDEMTFVKNLFFEPYEPAFQYHPPQSKYINVHQGCLHIWRPHNEQIPLPPLVMV
jgi:hypothetical protein